jgi:hypothetical protein
VTQNEPSWQLVVVGLIVVSVCAFFFAGSRRDARDNVHGVAPAWWAEAAIAVLVGVFFLGLLLVGLWRVIHNIL